VSKISRNARIQVGVVDFLSIFYGESQPFETEVVTRTLNLPAVANESKGLYQRVNTVAPQIMQWSSLLSKLQRSREGGSEIHVSL